uniref:Photosystem I reaction center subunit II, cyanelle n=1 Tax=Cyanophora paradoxa TaxID=2762 RepID=PSAD_CYAPA|nr:RecName: Full=Photosystem I reaction center subunit II, cyanelle; AltName: Full=Photosystem I 20 kDa subunit; Short=PSI-D; Flags: Precursor [Cyanophora paradoxa]7DR0_D Chain D, Photosystem I reaction center subunit II, cyanelle [Cyanophora paradoxa]7DR1_D Chain D, Photosystem I reaction center subunit II, cyanelle [Cyanophora paradoxa]7DR2_aD Chain aD, Photosystem I reaction center subunit II, cyanelle [Cyanophora paradoxa]7DR2_bD Chain bD, Photosystem I reaction center subunit II, cyanelle 
MNAFVASVAPIAVAGSATLSSAVCAQKKAFFGAQVAAKKTTFEAAPARFIVRAEEEEAAPAEKVEKKAAAPKPFSVPTLNLNAPTPIFGGSTGGLLRKAEVEEFYSITWTGKSETVFELPTGGAAIMRAGENLLRLARKEQCIALGAQLKDKFKITDYKIYRVYPSGEVQFLHPKDGVFPEKVNPGRVAVGSNKRRIGQNPDPAKLKFKGQETFDSDLKL